VAVVTYVPESEEVRVQSELNEARARAVSLFSMALSNMVDEAMTWGSGPQAQLAGVLDVHARRLLYAAYFGGQE